MERIEIPDEIACSALKFFTTNSGGWVKRMEDEGGKEVFRQRMRGFFSPNFSAITANHQAFLYQSGVASEEEADEYRRSLSKPPPAPPAPPQGAVINTPKPAPAPKRPAAVPLNGVPSALAKPTLKPQPKAKDLAALALERRAARKAEAGSAAEPLPAPPAASSEMLAGGRAGEAGWVAAVEASARRAEAGDAQGESKRARKSSAAPVPVHVKCRPGSSATTSEAGCAPSPQSS